MSASEYAGHLLLDRKSLVPLSHRDCTEDCRDGNANHEDSAVEFVDLLQDGFGNGFVLNLLQPGPVHVPDARLGYVS